MKSNMVIAMACAASIVMSACSGLVILPGNEPQLKSVALISKDEEFIQAVSNEAGEDVKIDVAQEIPQLQENGVAMLYLPEQQQISKMQGPGVVFTDEPDIIVEGISGVTVDHDAQVRAAWDVLYEYPSHCAPIRLLTLTKSRDGAAFKMYSELLENGKLQNKGCYVADEAELSPDEWTEKALQGVAVGLLDTIYAETADLAKAAYNALRAADRNDSVEVICAELTPELVKLMIEDHWCMGAAVGISVAEAADEMLELAEKIVETGENSVVALSPGTVYSEDVYKMFRDGIREPEEIMDRLMK